MQDETGAGGDTEHGGLEPEEHREEDLWIPRAEGVDPDAPDPGCVHHWQHLVFAEEDGDLACLNCGRIWSVEEDPREAVLTIWQSARIGFARLDHKVDRLADVVALMTGTTRCHWCDTWDEEDGRLWEVNDRRCCPEHLGQLLASRRPVEDADLGAARGTLQRTITESGDLYGVWLVEKALVECPEIETVGFDATSIGRHRLQDEPWLRRLGLPTGGSVVEVCEKAAQLLELPTPASRAGRALLLGMLARTFWASSSRHLLEEEVLAGVLRDAVPQENRDRATVVLDLFRHELPEEGSLDGDLADDLVEALVNRAAAELRELFL